MSGNEQLFTFLSHLQTCTALGNWSALLLRLLFHSLSEFSVTLRLLYKFRLAVLNLMVFTSSEKVLVTGNWYLQIVKWWQFKPYIVRLELRLKFCRWFSGKVVASFSEAPLLDEELIRQCVGNVDRS